MQSIQIVWSNSSTSWGFCSFLKLFASHLFGYHIFPGSNGRFSQFTIYFSIFPFFLSYLYFLIVSWALLNRWAGKLKHIKRNSIYVLKIASLHFCLFCVLYSAEFFSAHQFQQTLRYIFLQCSKVDFDLFITCFFFRGSGSTLVFLDSTAFLRQMEQYSRCRRHAQLLRYWFKSHCHSLQERLDFSCAMFGPDGGLVANAPHIPVHLGSMQETVQYQVEYNYFLLTFHMGMLFHYISVSYTVTQHGVAFFQDSHIRRWSEGRWRHTQ